MLNSYLFYVFNRALLFEGAYGRKTPVMRLHLLSISEHLLFLMTYISTQIPPCSRIVFVYSAAALYLKSTLTVVLGSFQFFPVYHLPPKLQWMYFAPSGWSDISESYLRKNLPFLSWNNVSNKPCKHSYKSIVIPERVKEMRVHDVYAYYDRTTKTKYVNSNTEARMHHFKNVSVWSAVGSYGVIDDPSAFFNTKLVDRWIKNIVFTQRQVYRSQK